MRSRAWRRSALCVLGCVLLAGCVPAPTLDWRQQTQPLPEVSLVRREAGDIERLAALRQRIDATLAHPDTDAAAASAAYLELGRHYMAHEFDGAAKVALSNAVALNAERRAAHYLLAVLLQREGNLADAQTHLLESLRIDPDSGTTLLRLGDLALAQNQTKVAIAYFEQAREDPLTALSAQAGLGRAALQQGDFASAVHHLTAVLARRPEASALRHPLAQALRESGRLDEARSELALAGSEPLAQVDPLIEALSKLVVGARSLALRAGRAKADGDLQTAEALYREAIRSDPDYALAHAGLGLLLAEQARYQEALAAYEQAAALDPRYPEAWLNIGTLQLRLGNTALAETAFVRVIEIDPQHWDARFRLAAILHQRGDAAASRRELEQILASAPAHIDALQSLVMVMVADGDVAAAQLLLQRASSELLEPDARAAVHLLEAHAATADGRSGDAIAAYRRAVEQDPAHFQAWFNLGQQLLAEGRADEAIDALGQALALQPENPQARLALAQAQMQDQRWPDARLTLEAGLTVEAASSDLLIALIELLAASPDATVRDGSRALELAQDATRATRNLRFMELTAMAAAELGDFDQAVSLTQRLIETATEQAAPADVQNRLRESLARYRAKQPFRMPAGRTTR